MKMNLNPVEYGVEMVTIRKYRTKYDDQILDLNKSLISKWYSLDDDKTKSVSWNKLTPKERYLHGGPWNDPDTLSIHINHMNRIGEILLLIDDSDNLIGQLEYHRIDNTFHLDWMLIHPKLQKKNYGRYLLNQLVKIAKKKKIRNIWTEPEDGVSGFYTKNLYEIIEPPYHRYKQKVRQGVNDLDWEEIKISEIDLNNICGEANNTPKYLLFLLQTGIKYTELFDEPYPILARYTEENVYITRNLPGFPTRSSLLVLSDQDELIHDLITNSEQYLREYNTYYFTHTGPIDIDWELFKTFLRLKRKVILD